MQQEQWIGDLGLIKCHKHNQKVILFSLEEGKKLEDRFLCEACLEMIDSIPKSLSWHKTKQALQDRHQQTTYQLNQERDRMLQLIKSLKNIVDQIKVKFIQTLDDIGVLTNQWIKKLELLKQEGVDVNQSYFLEQLVKIGNLEQELELNPQQKNAINQSSQCNHHFSSLIKSSLQKLLQFDFPMKLKEILPNIFLLNDRKVLDDQQQQFQRQLNKQLLVSFQEFAKHINISRDSLQSYIDKTDVYVGNDIHTLEPPKMKKIKQEHFPTITYQLMDEIKQENKCQAIAFNHQGTIMAAGYKQWIKIWSIEKNSLKDTEIVLQGHTETICCIIFSKKINWIASSGQDKTIRCWKEAKLNNRLWVSSQPAIQHTDSVFCMLLNKNEDQLFSCSIDKSIKVWYVDCNKNEQIYDYSLEKHQLSVLCISLNESETSLVSCSQDKQIIIWKKGQQKKWEFNYYITKSIDDIGYRISFINDNFIAWQPQKKGITAIFELENGVFKEKPELQITLNAAGNDGQCLFPSVYNSNRKILLQKHNKYVYIITQQYNGQFKVESPPIDCNFNQNYGGLTDNGEHLVIWNNGTKYLRLFKINYE